jgi:hypothetical protein
MRECSTGLDACQDPISITEVTKSRCPYCWTVRAVVDRSGRFTSYRVFCKHKGCPEWEKAHARLVAAPVARWKEKFWMEIRECDWKELRADLVGREADWLAMPQGNGRMVVIADCEFEGSSVWSEGVGKIAEHVEKVPDGERVRMAPKKDRETTGEDDLPFDPMFEMMIPGVSVEEMEAACKRAGVATERVGYYQDCVISRGEINAAAVARLEEELRMLRKRGSRRERGVGRPRKSVQV